jgi:hypothetical protein
MRVICRLAAELLAGSSSWTVVSGAGFVEWEGVDKDWR